MSIGDQQCRERYVAGALVPTLGWIAEYLRMTLELQRGARRAQMCQICVPYERTARGRDPRIRRQRAHRCAVYPDLVAYDSGIDGSGASGEDAAVHAAALSRGWCR